MSFKKCEFFLFHVFFGLFKKKGYIYALLLKQSLLQKSSWEQETMGFVSSKFCFSTLMSTFTSKKGQGILTDLLNLTTIFESKFAYPSQIPSLMPQQAPRYSWSWRNKSSESIGVNTGQTTVNTLAYTTGLFFPKIRWGERKENRKWCQWKWPHGSICPIWG